MLIAFLLGEKRNTRFKKKRLPILDYVGVAAAKLYIYFFNGLDRDWTWVAGMRGESDKHHATYLREKRRHS